MGDLAERLAAVVAELPGGGEVRDGQRTMAEEVERSIESGRHLVVQAGTGTGKTLAYLLPAVLSGTKVVVATATKALQDQLAGKDLPFLESHVGGFTSAVVKGRSNYACRQRIAELVADRSGTLDLDTDDPGLQAVLTWAEQTESGDRAELSVEPRQAVWESVSVTSQECPGAAKCPQGERCFAEHARRQAADADVVVVNAHLYGTHLAAGGVVLPPHDLVVIDEAHRLEEVISSTAGSELSAGRIQSATYAVGRVLDDPNLQSQLLADAVAFGDVLDQHLGDRLDPMPAAIVTAATTVRGRLDDAAAALKKVPDDNADVVAKRTRAQTQLTSLSIDLQAIQSVADTDVAWVEGRPGSAKLRVAPVDVAAVLREQLWSEVTAVLCSATIPPRLDQRLGLPEGNTTVIDVGSPFDYATQALLYCATSLPDPRSDRDKEVARELITLIDAAGGRTLALFTSWRAMKAAVENVRDRVSVPVLAQGERPKPALLTAFTDDPATCLFATLSFWEGVDVPGETLSLVTIDKLPFARPDDPLLEARRELAGPRAFELIDLPRATTLLAQGAGRLIRSTNDRGVVAVLDPRLATARYRWDLVNGLPPMRRTKDRAEVEDFLRSLR